MTKTARLLTVLICLIIVGRAQAEDRAPIKIGWIGPLTGNAAVLGVDTVPSIEIAFHHINKDAGTFGRMLQLVTEDDQYNAAKAVTAYEKLVHQDKVNVIVILTYGAVFSLADRAMKDNVLLIDPLDCDENIAKLPENVLCITKMTEDLGYTNASDVIASDGGPVGVIYYEGDPFMGIAAEATAKKFAEHGLKWAFSAPYSEATTDFRTPLLKAKRAGVKSLFFYGYDQMGLAMKQARSLGITAQFYTLATSTSPGFQKLAGPALEGVKFPTWQAPRNTMFSEFLDLFKSKVGRAPYMEICVVQSYDIARLIAEGIKKTNLAADGSVDMKGLRAFFYGLRNYQGASGGVTVDPDGATRSYKITLSAWRGGTPEPVKQ